MPSTESVYERLAQNMSDLVALHSPDGRYLWVSPSVERILGFTPNELVGTDPYALFHPNDKQLIRNKTHQPAVDGDGNIRIRYRIRRSVGDYIWFETLTQPITNEIGKVVELQTISRDVTEQVNLENELAESETLYRVAMDSLQEGVVVHDGSGQIIAHNPRACDILGLTGDELTGRVPKDPQWRTVYTDGTPFPAQAHPVLVTLNSGEPCSNVLMGVHNPRWNAYRWICINSRLIETSGCAESGQARVVVSFSDVTEQVERESQLKRWSTVYRFSGEAIVIADENGVIKDANESFLRITQSTRAFWVGRSLDDISLDGRSEGLFSSTIWPALAENGNWRGELWLRDAEGGIQATWAAITKVQQTTTAEAHYTLILSDFSERGIKDETLRFSAGNDPLTGLPNRLLLSDRFEVALNTSIRQGTTFACLYLDLDKFKPINDLYGHAVGDTVLQSVALKISKLVRSVDTIARIGGDEFFGIIVGLENESEYCSVAERIARAISEPFEVCGHSVSLGVSIGIALYPDHGQTQTALMEASDVAMFEAKRQGLSYALAEKLDKQS
ncbi:diguanylate cyclase [Marinobacter sp. S6332]|uniref:sensor domain-containing protein n=1 Tax=Marinobacter sp. S6332 TaxID=2926403 RepID=UPI001FF2FD4E|nr:diguanylate cyclase [Marinobacter sp. S6332]MCK0164171.1 diguanylate cyclase [Marinobacter sp. S6332]